MSGSFVVPSALSGPDGAKFREPTSTLLHHTEGVIIVAAITLLASWVAVGLRIHVRSTLINRFGLDDWAMVVTQVLFTAQAVLMACTAGFFIQDVEQYAAGLAPVSRKVPNLIVAAWTLYGGTMLAYKFALGFFFLRLFDTRKRYVWFIVANMAIPCVAGLANLIYTIVSPCGVQSLFFADLPFCPATTSHKAILAIAECWTLLNAISDALYAGLSIHAVIKLRLPFKQRAIASFLCALGCAGGIVSWVRLGLLLNYDYDIPLLGMCYLTTILCLLEPGLGITAASIATLRPLLRNTSLDSSFSGAQHSPARVVVYCITPPQEKTVEPELGLQENGDVR